jgi:hypothetical protein
MTLIINGDEYTANNKGYKKVGTDSKGYET